MNFVNKMLQSSPMNVQFPLNALNDLNQLLNGYSCNKNFKENSRKLKINCSKI